MRWTEAQLELFQSRRQRGQTPPPALEFRTCCALADTIDLMISEGWIYSHLPFGEHRNAITGARLKRLGTKRGWCDYAFIGPDRAAFWLEMKRAKLGRRSDEQIAFAEHLKRNGHDYFCASSYDEAVAALSARGIIKTLKAW